MNIQDARIQIERAIRIYLKKDENGEYLMPTASQRPIFLIGAPGIGKTAIMAQIAAKLGLNLVSYSMTHHTRQSALGLPFIQERHYDGNTVHISEYTMSEIIASIHDTMEASGIREGILFLDEINCVSETLAPAMLQFLQYKVFGRHHVPDGWVIVTAGNPPAYNRTVREFDIATLDRLRVLEVEEDYDTWRTYAKSQGVHSAVVGFLDLKTSYFYHIETTVEGKRYVTARGWNDLSDTLHLYEAEGLPVDRHLIDPIIRQPKIAREFAAYYDLFILYEKTYRVPDILSGKWDDAMLERARSAAFDERLSLIGLLTTAIQRDCHDYCLQARLLSHLMQTLSAVKTDFLQGIRSEAIFDRLIENENNWLARSKAANHLTNDEQKWHRQARQLLTIWQDELLRQGRQGTDAYETLRTLFKQSADNWEAKATSIGERLHHLFTFAEIAFADSESLLIIATELTVNAHSATFLAERGHPDYERHKEGLALEDRRLELLQHVENLAL